MNILVTGCNGQLGSEIRHLSPEFKNHSFLFTDIEELNITNYEAIKQYVTVNKIDYIVNCAAYTAVDKAESQHKQAYALNARAVGNLARISRKFGMLLIHVSTDYVFNGTNYIPYTETDKTRPRSVYGKTKHRGERKIFKSADWAIIIRTSWLYSSFGNNFVKSIIKNAKEKGKLSVVYDQVGTPTYARDLAEAILNIIQLVDGRQPEVEIYNYSNEGVCSWYDFAKTIVELEKIECEISPIETKDYPTPARRPHYSVLNKNKIKDHYKIQIPY